MIQWKGLSHFLSRCPYMSANRVQIDMFYLQSRMINRDFVQFRSTREHAMRVSSARVRRVLLDCIVELLTPVPVRMPSQVCLCPIACHLFQLVEQVPPGRLFVTVVSGSSFFIDPTHLSNYVQHLEDTIESGTVVRAELVEC